MVRQTKTLWCIDLPSSSDVSYLGGTWPLAGRQDPEYGSYSCNDTVYHKLELYFPSLVGKVA